MTTLKQLKAAAAKHGAEVEVIARESGRTVNVWLDEDSDLIWESTGCQTIFSHWFCGKAAEQYAEVLTDISAGVTKHQEQAA